MELAETLANNYVFRGLPETEINELASLAEVKEYRGGDRILRQFEKSFDVFVILEGKALSRTFKEEIVSEFGPGSVVGEIALIDRKPRSTNVVSVGNSKVAIIPATAILAIMNRDINAKAIILENIVNVLCMRLRAMNEHVDSMTVPFR